MSKVKRYTTSIVLLLFCTFIFAQVAYAYIANGARWSSNNALYCFDSSMPDSYKSYIMSAAYSWNQVTNFSLYNSPNTSNSWGCEDFGYANGTLATTRSSIIPILNTFAYCWTTFNTYYTFTTDPWSGGYDVQSIAVHEFGHWLFLDDEYDLVNDIKSVMYYKYDGGNCRSLTSDDRAGITDIYGSN